MINTVGAAHRADMESYPSGDRFYQDFRGLQYPDIGSGVPTFTVNREDNLIDRGNCESAVAPMMFGEWNPTLSNATVTRSSTQAHSGTYSFEITTDGVGNGQFIWADNTGNTDMHGFVPGQTAEAAIWLYIPSGGLTGSQVTLRIAVRRASTATTTQTSVTAAETFDKWQLVTLSRDIDSDATAFYVFLQTEAVADVIYVDDIKVSAHAYPGSHRMTGGYSEHLVTLPDTGTIQLEFVPQFAYDTGTSQNLMGWALDGSRFFIIVYNFAGDIFRVAWIDGGNARVLDSAQYDDGTAERNIAQEISLTVAWDLTTGDTTGSSLWLNKTQDDTSWNAASDVKTSSFNKMRLRNFDDGNATGAYDILSVRYFPNYIATDADVQNDFQNVTVEEIHWDCNGHMNGVTRVNTTRFLQEYRRKNTVHDLLTGRAEANVLDFELLSTPGGEFADDQYAAYVPASDQFNGTTAQKYLQKKNRVFLENWYNGDYDSVFAGQLVGNYTRNSFKKFSSVRGTAADSLAVLNVKQERNGNFWEDYVLSREDNLMDRGNCESATVPAIFGETANTLSNATFAQSTAQFFQGANSYLFTKTIAAGTEAYASFQDNEATNDLHGLAASKEYKLGAWVYIPSGGILGTEITLQILDYVAGWVATSQAAANAYDEWQYVEATRTLNAGIGGTAIKVVADSAAALNETFYIDNIRLTPTDRTEAHDQSLFHLIAHRADRIFKQYAADNSVEGTIGNSYVLSGGGTLTQEADPLFGTNAGQVGADDGADEDVSQTTLFTGIKKLNVGDTYNFSVFLKSAGATTKSIYLYEEDSGAPNDNTSAVYALDGGEDWVKNEVTHTITDPDSDRLRLNVDVEDGDVVKFEGIMLIQNDRSLNYFDANALEGAAGVESADDAPEISWPWFGIVTDNVNIIHPWKRLDRGATPGRLINAEKDAVVGETYFDEAGTLRLKSPFHEFYSDPVQMFLISVAQTLGVSLIEARNRIEVHGVDIVKEIAEALVWMASATDVFPENALGFLNEAVASGATWPATATFGDEFVARYGTVGGTAEEDVATGEPGERKHAPPQMDPGSGWF